MKKIYLVFVAFLIICEPASSQWNTNTSINTALCIQPYDQQDARIVTDSKGGAIITWLDFRGDATQAAGDIYIQRIDKNGFVKWTSSGVSLCNLATDQAAPSISEDGAGGAIIAWNDSRNGNRDIYAQKIDSSGNVLWTINGIAVCTKVGEQMDAKLISDGAGGVIAVWQDSSSGSFDIYSQRVSSAGAIMWTAGGVTICNSLLAQINPRIETDANGGAIITWQDKLNGNDYDIYAQRINSSGAVQWTSNGVAVCNVAGTQSNPKIEPDGAGGAYIGWQDKRNGNYDIYANRLNSAGLPQWNGANGWGVSVEPGSQSALDMTSEGVNGVYFTWKDDRNGTFDIYYQRADANGAMQFALGGNSVFLATYDQINPNIVGDGSGGAIIVWQDSSAGNWDVMSQRVDASGAQQWNLGGIVVGNAIDNQTSPKSVSDGSGGCVYTWQDKRSSASFDIYAHRILSNGVSAGIITENNFVESRIFPNPFSSAAAIVLQATINGKMEFSVFDILGTKIEIPFVVSQNEIIISRGYLNDGIYFYEIKTDTSISTGKLIMTD